MATLALIFKGSDETKATVNDVAGGLRDVGSAADEASSKGGGFFSNLLSTATGFLAADVVSAISGQVIGFAADAFEAARGTEQLMASTEQTIKTMGNAAGVSAEHVAEMAAALSDAAGKSLFGDDQIQQSTNLLLTFGEIKGATLDAATALTVDLAAALGGAPQDQAMMLGKALNDPIKGITALGKAGLTFSEEQKAAIAAMVESGDIAGAQAVIIEELNKQVGGQAQAQAEAAGGMVQFQARLGEVGETVAAALLPVLDQLASLLLEYVAPALETAATWLGENLPGAIATVSEWINTIIGMFASAGDSSSELSGILSELGDIWTLIAEIIAIEVELILAVVMPAFEEISTFLAAHSEEINAVLDAAWTIIKTTIDTALTIIKGVLTAALQIIKGDWSGAWETVKTMFSDVWDNITTILMAELEIAKNLLSMAWDAIEGGVQSAWDGITSTISNAVGDLVDTIMSLPDQVAGVGEAVVDTIRDGISGAWDRLVSWFDDKLAELTAKLPFSEPKDSSSPLYGLSKSGVAIITNILEGLEQAIPNLLAAVDGMGDDLMGQVADIADQIGTALGDAFDASAAIDRTAVRNIDAVRKFAAELQGGIQAELDKALEESRKIQDPEEARAFYELRSDQILELARAQQDLMAAQQGGDARAIADAQKKLDLITSAQEAERQAFAQRQQGQSQTEQIQAAIAALFSSPNFGSVSPDLLNLIISLANQLGGGAPLLPAPPPMGAGGQGLRAGGLGGGAVPGGQANVVVSFDERGAMAWLQQFVRVTVNGVLLDTSAAANRRGRTGV